MHCISLPAVRTPGLDPWREGIEQIRNMEEWSVNLRKSSTWKGQLQQNNHYSAELFRTSTKYTSLWIANMRLKTYWLVISRLRRPMYGQLRPHSTECDPYVNKPLSLRGVDSFQPRQGSLSDLYNDKCVINTTNIRTGEIRYSRRWQSIAVWRRYIHDITTQLNSTSRCRSKSVRLYGVWHRV